MKIKKNLFIIMSIVVVEIILIKLFMFSVLPPKYFYDSNRILQLMSMSYSADASYIFTAKFFNFINIFKLNSLLKWSFTLGVLGNIPILLIIKNNKNYNFGQYLFIIMGVALLNIYVFTLSKDFIQFLFFGILYLIITNKKLTNKKKILFSCFLFIIESLYFRLYYLIIAILILTIYIIYNLFIKNKIVDKKNLFRIIILSVIVFIAEIFVLGNISSSNYELIMNARSTLNASRINAMTDAETMIVDPLGKNRNIGVFAINYILNFIRLFFPIELLLKSAKYFPFIIFQILILTIIIKNAQKIDNNNLLLLIVILSYFMTSVIFEPDFGSFIRHESALFLLLLEMININIKRNVKQI